MTIDEAIQWFDTELEEIIPGVSLWMQEEVDAVNILLAASRRDPADQSPDSDYINGPVKQCHVCGVTVSAATRKCGNCGRTLAW